MVSQGEDQRRDNKVGKIIIILLVGMAALSSVVKDLNNLQMMVGELRGFANEWLGSMAPSACASTVPGRELTLRQTRRSEEFRWTGHVTAGKAIEIKGINGDITAEPGTGSEVEVSANKTSRRSDPADVKIQFVEHPGGVTICAIYPSDDPDARNTCEPGTTGGRNSSTSSSVRNNDVRVDFIVRVPAGVGFVGRTVNGEIKAASLAGNVDSHTVNGSINISTTGYAQAATVNGEISARIGNSNWQDAIEFATVNGGINLDLPADLNTQVKAQTLNGQIVSDFPLVTSGVLSRKRVDGTIGTGGRQLVARTLNGSINLRRAQ